MNAPADNCPACLTPGHSEAVQPHRTEADGDSIVAHYWCGGCGNSWRTSWLVSAIATDAGEPAA